MARRLQIKLERTINKRAPENRRIAGLTPKSFKVLTPKSLHFFFYVFANIGK